MSSRLPAPIRRRPFRLGALKEKRARWAAARAARRALFARPTPISDRLQIAANLHKALDYLYVLFVLFFGLRILGQIAGYALHQPPLLLLTYVTRPVTDLFAPYVPPLQIGASHWIDLPALTAIVLGGLLNRLLHGFIHLLAYRRPLFKR